MTMFLGVDGGGSKTVSWIGNHDSILGCGLAGGSNVLRGGESQARHALQASIRQACAAAKISPDHIERACIGAAGAGRPEIAELIRKIALEILHCPVEVVGDMVVALHAACNGGPGVIVIAGTGSIAYGRDPKGNTARAGGLGAAVSDEGSGHWIGRQAVEAAIATFNQNPRPVLLQAIMATWCCGTQEEVESKMAAAASAENSIADFARLFPTVQSAANADDPAAIQILIQAAGHLAHLADVVIEKLQLEANFDLATAGGVFAHSPIVRETFMRNAIAAHPAVNVCQTVVQPVQGALDRARNATRQVPPEVRLESGLQ